MKIGLGNSYDDVSVLPEKIRAYLDLTQPASTLGIGVGVFLASWFYMFYTGESTSLHTMVFVSVTVMAAHGGSQALNQAEDAYMDKHTPHKQNRPIPAGVVSEDEARSIAWILIFLAVGRGFLFNPIFGTFIIVTSFMGVLYNLEPVRAKERIISIPWQAVSRGLLSFPLIWAAYGDITETTPWALGIFMFFYVLAFQNTADIIDKKYDEEFGVRTFIVEFGVKRTSMIASGSMLLMMATLLLSVNFNILEERFILMLLIMPFCIMMLYYMTFHSDTISESTGNHPSYLLYYLGMVLIVAIPLTVEVMA